MMTIILTLLVAQCFYPEVNAGFTTYVESWSFQLVPTAEIEPSDWIDFSSDCYAAEFYARCHLGSLKAELSNPRLDPFIVDRMAKGSCQRTRTETISLPEELKQTTVCCIHNDICCEQEGDLTKAPISKRKKEDFLWKCLKADDKQKGYTCCWPSDLPCYDFKEKYCSGSGYENWTTVSPFLEYELRGETEFVEGGLGAVEIIAIVMFSLFLLTVCGCVAFQNRDQSKMYLEKRKEMERAMKEKQKNSSVSRV